MDDSDKRCHRKIPTPDGHSFKCSWRRKVPLDRSPQESPHTALRTRAIHQDVCGRIFHNEVSCLRMYEGCLSRSTHASGYDGSYADIRGGDLDTLVPRLDQPTQACLQILSRRAGDFVSELDAAIRGCVEQINDRVTRYLGASRRALFEQVEPSALK